VKQVPVKGANEVKQLGIQNKTFWWMSKNLQCCCNFLDTKLQTKMFINSRVFRYCHLWTQAIPNLVNWNMQHELN